MGKIKDYFNITIKYVRAIFIGIIIGVLLCVGLYYKFQKERDTNSPTIITRTIQGAPLIIKRYIYKDKETTIDTQYTGEGESTITIPNSLIPSARKWDEDHWLAGGFVSTDKSIYIGGGYRYDRFMVIAGPWFRNDSKGYTGGLWIGGFVNF